MVGGKNIWKFRGRLTSPLHKTTNSKRLINIENNRTRGPERTQKTNLPGPHRKQRARTGNFKDKSIQSHGLRGWSWVLST